MWKTGNLPLSQKHRPRHQDEDHIAQNKPPQTHQSCQVFFMPVDESSFSLWGPPNARCGLPVTCRELRRPPRPTDPPAPAGPLQPPAQAGLSKPLSVSVIVGGGGQSHARCSVERNIPGMEVPKNTGLIQKGKCGSNVHLWFGTCWFYWNKFTCVLFSGNEKKTKFTYSL